MYDTSQPHLSPLEMQRRNLHHSQTQQSKQSFSEVNPLYLTIIIVIIITIIMYYPLNTLTWSKQPTAIQLWHSEQGMRVSTQTPNSLNQ
jgi:hypothetical protein